MTPSILSAEGAQLLVSSYTSTLCRSLGFQAQTDLNNLQ